MQILFQVEGTIIQSMDACFGLSRKKAKGCSLGSSRHGNLLFADQDDVDNFVDNYMHTSITSKERVMY